MAERRVVVAPGVGLHARPAALFVKAAGATGLPVTIAKDGTPAADARSILSVLSLDVRGGEEVVLTVEGENADSALDALSLLLTSTDA